MRLGLVVMLQRWKPPLSQLWLQQVPQQQNATWQGASAPQNCSTWKETGEISAFVDLQLNSSQTGMRTDVHGMGKKASKAVLFTDCYQLPPAADLHVDNGHWYEVTVMPGEGRPSKGKQQHTRQPLDCVVSHCAGQSRERAHRRRFLYHCTWNNILDLTAFFTSVQPLANQHVWIIHLAMDSPADSLLL